MALAKVFIASSSEGLEVAQTVRALLSDALRDRADLRPWTREFELSATYIESLERAVEDADFAVFVVTPDDLTISRSKKKSAPRDNVVFELGLFMGNLGRGRCLVVNEESADLKLPTDLLGFRSAGFRRSADRNLKSSLDAACLTISERITTLGNRYKLSKDFLKSQAALQRSAEAIEGHWWERVTTGGVNAISFVCIEPTPLSESVSLSGKSYDQEGRHVANWKSLIARLDQSENKVIYHWQGWHTLPDLANIKFHGFGEVEFDKPREGQWASRGEGKFWEINETHPEQTIVKTTQIRRVADTRHVGTMTDGSEKVIGSLVKKTLLGW